MATILIIEGRLLTREYLATVLGYAHHRVLEEADGAKALKLAKNETVDLIITDILMLTMDGFDLINQLRENSALKKIPIIFYTATYPMKEARSLAKSCDVHFVLKNPSKPKIILETVQKALGDTRSLPIEKLASILKVIPTGPSPIGSLTLSQLNKILSKRFAEIDSIRKSFKSFIKSTREFAEEHELSMDKINTLSKNLGQLHYLTNQLVNMAKINMDLFSENDPNKFLRVFCKKSCKILGAKYSAVGILNTKGTQIEQFLAFGMGSLSQSKADFRSLMHKGLVGKILKQRSFLKRDAHPYIPKDELFPNHPSITSFLGFPILSKSHLYGFIYFADKIKGNIFNDEDAHIAEILVSELSVLYEIFEYYQMMQHLITKLHLEIIKRKNVEKDLRKNELIFRQFAENINEIFWRTNPTMDEIIYLSPAYEEIFGYPVSDVYANPYQWFECILPEDQPRVKAALDLLMQNKQNAVIMKFRIRRRDGEIRHMYSRGFLVKDKKGKITNILGFTNEITELSKIQEYDLAKEKIAEIFKVNIKLNKITNKILKIIGGMHNLNAIDIWIADRTENALHCIDFWSKPTVNLQTLAEFSYRTSFKKGFGLPGKVWQIKNKLWVSNVEKALHSHRKSFFKKVESHSALCVPIVFKHQIYGVIEYFFPQVAKIDPDLSNHLAAIGEQFGEFIFNQHTQEQLTHISHHDILTGLMNISFLEEVVTKRFKTSLAITPIIFLDVDRFKSINEALGSEIGDLLLKAIGVRLSNLQECLSARIGADKFVLIFTNIHNIAQVYETIVTVKNLFTRPFIIEENDIFIFVSMGISLYPKNGLKFSTLLQKAEIATQNVKKIGGNHFQFSSEIVTSVIKDKLLLEMDLPQALKKNQFCLYYQPKVNLRTGLICGLEALIRWKHPKKGLLLPGSFIALAEEANLIISLEEWMVHEVFRQIKDKEIIGTDDTSIAMSLPISINLSIGQFNERYRFFDYTEKLMKAFDINPELIEFEITESILAKDVKSIIKFIGPIKKLGVKLSLDDFGTGYCSLKYLQQFAIDRIKIDKSFIDGIPHDLKNLTLVRAIISLARNLGILVIAEGVETEEQVKCLIEENCDEMQGFYFSKPLPVDQIKKMIREGKRLMLPS